MNTKIIQHAIDAATLPEGAQWLKINGQTVFPYYGVSGGLGSGVMAYMFSKFPTDAGFGYDLGTGDGVVHEGYGGKWVSIQFSITDTIFDAVERVIRSYKALYV